VGECLGQGERSLGVRELEYVGAARAGLGFSNKNNYKTYSQYCRLVIVIAASNFASAIIIEDLAL